MKGMRLHSGLMFLVCGACVWAQSSDDPEVARANANIERLRALVQAGAAPRAQLAQAEEAVADARDEAFLRRTAYGKDLTEAQADDMVNAAGRRLERRRKAFDEARKLVDAGVKPQLSLAPFQEDMDRARQECDLAEARADVVREVTQMARAEELLETRLAEEPSTAHEIAERYDGDGVLTTAAFARIEVAFERHFGKPLPISAIGETAVHRAMGFDHRGRVDVALHPDTPEGVWLREYLNANRIPYFAFRQAIPGKATGAHIHLGPMSTRLISGG
jgi:hypothetical protein